MNLKDIPHKPGVYRMIDKEGRVIYVGKAKDLKKRVSQYFQNKTQGPRTKKLVENISDIKYTVVDTELEALILELNLIKELRPKYNILLKDDKNFVYIMISNEEFPRVQIVRKITDKKATYYGPKTSQHKVEKTLKILKKVLPFRHCNLEIETDSTGKAVVTRKTIKYPCLDFYIKRCVAPCINEISKEDYAKLINQVKNFFEGHHEEIIKSLKEQMATLATKKEFEKAAKIRDRIKNIEEIQEKQKISDPNQEDKDIINYVIEGHSAYFNLFQVREGKLISHENFILQNAESEEALDAFLAQYYEKCSNIPKEILIPHEIQDQQILEEYLSKEKNQKVAILIPQKGQKSKLLELSLKNAKIYADRNKISWQEENKEHITILEELKKLLDLKSIPKRIECYDISHLSGTNTVGSMIVFENGIPAKDMYRKFKIRTVEGKPDDYKSLEEMLSRRLSHLGEIKDEYTIEKAKKSDQKFIEEQSLKDPIIDKREILYKSYLVARKNKKICGFVREKIVNNVHKISSLWVSEEERGNHIGHRLLRKLIKNSKGKRLYLNCQESLTPYYEQIGFERIKAIPKELEEENKYWHKIECDCGETKPGVWFAYDKKKHTDKSFNSKPDLMIIDGGKGQLGIATKTLKTFALDFPIISIAKQEEEIFTNTTNKAEPVRLDRSNPVLKLIQRSRDEAHRFAIEFNKKLREKTMKE